MSDPLSEHLEQLSSADLRDLIWQIEKLDEIEMTFADTDEEHGEVERDFNPGFTMAVLKEVVIPAAEAHIATYNITNLSTHLVGEARTAVKNGNFERVDEIEDAMKKAASHEPVKFDSQGGVPQATLSET
jgi:hypothetical protein